MLPTRAKPVMLTKRKHNTEDTGRSSDIQGLTGAVQWAKEGYGGTKKNEMAAIDGASTTQPNPPHPPRSFVSNTPSLSLSSPLPILSIPTPPPLSLSFPPSRSASLHFHGTGAGFGGKAGSRVVMSCQQCSDGSLTYFQKYHRFLFISLLSSVPFKHISDGWHKEH